MLTAILILNVIAICSIVYVLKKCGNLLTSTDFKNRDKTVFMKVMEIEDVLHDIRKILKEAKSEISGKYTDTNYKISNLSNSIVGVLDSMNKYESYVKAKSEALEEIYKYSIAQTNTMNELIEKLCNITMEIANKIESEEKATSNEENEKIAIEQENPASVSSPVEEETSRKQNKSRHKRNKE